MSPIDQIDGDERCFSACVASLLHLELADTPDFCAVAEDWFNGFHAWLVERGFGAIMLNCAELKAVGATRYFKGALLIAGGQSPRHPSDPSKQHAVLWRDGALVHDPHPDRRGIIGEPVDVTLIFRLEPK